MNSLLANTVSKLLPGNWTVEENEHNPENCSLVRHDGLILGTLKDWNKKGADHVFPRYPGMDSKGNISPHFSRVDVRELGETSPSINVSYSKNPTLIARDIENRLLPDASRIYTKILLRAEEIREKNKIKDSGFQEISDFLQIPINQEQIYFRKNQTSTSIKTSNGKDFKMEISGLSPELVKEIALLIKEKTI